MMRLFENLMHNKNTEMSNTVLLKNQVAYNSWYSF